MSHKNLRRRLTPPPGGRSGSARASVPWAFALTSAATFMVTLDNLVVTTAIPVIRRDLHAGIGGLEWTVNAYTLTFAVLLLTGAALGDRFGRRRLLAIGLGIFTLASAAAALVPLVLLRLDESRGSGRFDLPGLGLASAGLFGIVWGLVRANTIGWGSPQIVGALVLGAVLTAAFVAWELRASAPMLPMQFFR